MVSSYDRRAYKPSSTSVAASIRRHAGFQVSSSHKRMTSKNLPSYLDHQSSYWRTNVSKHDFRMLIKASTADDQQLERIAYPTTRLRRRSLQRSLPKSTLCLTSRHKCHDRGSVLRRLRQRGCYYAQDRTNRLEDLCPPSDLVKT